MKKLLSFVAAVLFAATTFAKEGELKDVTLVTNGSGKTKQEAVNLALRSALEQTFGTFVSANTQIVNDKLTKDEIVSISTGNIKNYKELSSAVLPSGQFAVVVQSTISLSKLTSYAKSHGSSCELAGATFAQNMKLRKLNKENEKKVLENLKEQLKELEKSLFDISIESGTPKISKTFLNAYDIPITLTLKGCENSDACIKLLFSTLDNLNLSEEERSDYDRTNDKYWRLNIAGRTYYLRNKLTSILVDLNRMLREMTIRIHGKHVLYYKLDINSNTAEIRACPYDQRYPNAYKAWSSDNNYPIYDKYRNPKYNIRTTIGPDMPISRRLGISGNNWDMPLVGNWESARTHYGEGEGRSGTASMSRIYDPTYVEYINQLPYIYDTRENHEYIYNIGAYYTPQNSSKRKKGKSETNYNTITYLHFDIIIPQSEMESISNIEVIVP